MSDELHHECGVAAVYHAGGQPISRLVSPRSDINRVAHLIPRMLLDMQNRGQLAAGMSSYRPDRGALIQTHKQLGTVAEAFRLNHKAKFDNIMADIDGPAAIGHVRYATCGADDKSYAQPFERAHGRKAKWFAFAFNGQLANFAKLKQELLDKGDYHLKRNTDTEILMHALSFELAADGDGPNDWAGIFRRMAAKFDGAYNVVLLTAQGELVVVRDPLGIRPLCIAQDGPLFAAASESVPLANLGFSGIKSLEPGTLVVVNEHGVRHERFAPAKKPAHCFFEWIYFANVASTLDDRSVYLSRAALGKELARVEDVPLDADTIVVPVPDTAKAAADAMAFALGVPSVEGLMRNRYVGRTFIEGQGDRAAKVRVKYTPLPEVLSGKRVLLVEDSIVRSTTMRALVSEIRNRGGAREIHVRVACPPIIAPCYYGIDMSTRNELVAPKFADQADGGLSEAAFARLAVELEADSLRYLPVDALARSVGLASDHLCRACVTGRYPTPVGQELYEKDAPRLRRLRRHSRLRALAGLGRPGRLRSPQGVDLGRVGRHQLAPAEQADEPGAVLDGDDRNFIEIQLRQPPEGRVEVVLRRHGQNRPSRQVVGEDERAEAGAGQREPDVAERENPGHLAEVVDHREERLRRVRQPPQDLVERGRFGDQFQSGLADVDLLDPDSLQDVDDELAQVRRAVDRAGDLLLVERPAPGDPEMEPADEHQGDEQAVRAGHLADHHDRGQRRLGNSGEEPSHADQGECRRVDAPIRADGLEELPHRAAEHAADEDRRPEDAAAAAGADRHPRRDDLQKGQEKQQTGGHLRLEDLAGRHRGVRRRADRAPLDPAVTAGHQLGEFERHHPQQ